MLYFSRIGVMLADPGLAKGPSWPAKSAICTDALAFQPKSTKCGKERGRSSGRCQRFLAQASRPAAREWRMLERESSAQYARLRADRQPSHRERCNCAPIALGNAGRGSGHKDFFGKRLNIALRQTGCWPERRYRGGHRRRIFIWRRRRAAHGVSGLSGGGLEGSPAIRAAAEVGDAKAILTERLFPGDAIRVVAPEFPDLIRQKSDVRVDICTTTVPSGRTAARAPGGVKKRYAEVLLA